MRKSCSLQNSRKEWESSSQNDEQEWLLGVLQGSLQICKKRVASSVKKKKKKALAVTAQNVNSKYTKRCFASFVIGEIERSQWTIATAATTHTHTGGAETAGQGPRVKEGLTGGKAQAVLTGLKTKQPGTTQSRNLWWKSGDIMICGPEVLLRIQIQVCSCTWTHVQRRPQQCYLWEQSNRHHPMSINKRRINYDDSTLQGRATNCWYSEQPEQTSQTQCWRAEASHASGQFTRSGIILFRETCIAIKQWLVAGSDCNKVEVIGEVEWACGGWGCWQRSDSWSGCCLCRHSVRFQMWVRVCIYMYTHTYVYIFFFIVKNF